jgi:RimJ/RimL family protein N-acetyltransferase
VHDELVIENAVLLATQRLDLEPLRVGHADEMAAVLADVRLHAFIGGSPPDAAQLREQYRRQVVGRSPDGTQRWLNWIVRRREDGAALGYVQATITHASAAEVAWVVGTAHQGAGYAREAARAMVAWLREQGVKELLAYIHPGNGASETVARAVGLAPTDTVVDGEVCWRS